MAFRRIILNLHLYAGLAAALFLTILGVTGSIMVFEDQIDGWLNPQPVLHQRFRQLGIRQSRWIKLANVTGRVEQSRQERIYDSQNDNNLTARCERRNRPLNCGIGSEAR